MYFFFLLFSIFTLSLNLPKQCEMQWPMEINCVDAFCIYNAHIFALCFLDRPSRCITSNAQRHLPYTQFLQWASFCVPAAWPRQSNTRLVIIATTILCAYVAVRIRACAVAVASRFASWFNGFFYIYIYVNLLALFCLLNLKVYLISKLR